MSRRCAVAEWGFLITICLSQFFLFPASAAENLPFRRTLATDEKECLAELIHASDWWKYTSQFADEMMRIAKVARSNLRGKGEPAYLYLFDDGGWCGTAGCPILIGKRQGSGECLLLYDGNAADKIIVRRARDHGYQRLDLPCEIRFDGRHYQQLHPACPTDDVRH